MEPFKTVKGVVLPIDRSNVDTDAIIPKQYLKSVARSGFGANLFDEWRYLDHGEPGQEHSNRPINPDFVLNKKKRINYKKNNQIKKWLLEPTKIYVKEFKNLIKSKLINGCAHITGGGIKDNLSRIIPKGKCAEINLNKIKTKRVFSWLKKNNISDNEMIKTFNCGVGFCLIAESKNLLKIQKKFKKDFKPYIIGKIVSGKKKIELNEKIFW